MSGPKPLPPVVNWAIDDDVISNPMSYLAAKLLWLSGRQPIANVTATTSAEIRKGSGTGPSHSHAEPNLPRYILIRGLDLISGRDNSRLNAISHRDATT